MNSFMNKSALHITSNQKNETEYHTLAFLGKNSARRSKATAEPPAPNPTKDRTISSVITLGANPVAMPPIIMANDPTYVHHKNTRLAPKRITFPE